jgi:hypothetical protein
MNRASDVVITLVYDAVPKREECISVLRTSDKGWRVVRLDNVVVVVNCYLGGLAMPLEPVRYVVEVDLLDLVEFVHGCILVP